jgi:signal transduction histidine kinase/ActR/RegA family two-component response regulator
MASPSEHYEQQAELGLLERLHQCQTRLQLLKSISTRINSGLAANQIVERTLKETNKNFPHLRISYSVIDSSRVLRVLHSIGLSEAPALAGRDWPLSGVSALEQALAAGQVIVACDVATDERLLPLRDLILAGATRALLVVPIPQPEQQTGLLSFASGEPHTWEAHEIATLTDMAEYLAIALRESHHERERVKIEQHLRDSQRVEAAGRLVGGIAHDFNNLLTGMMIYCGLLETALGKDHRLQRHVHEIRSAGERGAELVAQLLASTSQQVLEPKIISINQVLIETQDMLRRLIREDIMLALRCDEDLRFTRVDPGQIQQVVLNLAINARDAMPNGGQLWIETSNCTVDEKLTIQHPGLQPGEYVLLSISDSGQGIDDATLPHIFEPFFTTKSVGEGTGLGLATVEGIVKQHGGYIAVESAAGRGTSFEIFLPSVEALAHKDVDSEGTASEAAPLQAKGESLLLVEDDEMVRRSLVESLRSSGFHVLEAAGGEQALKIATKHEGPIPLMITDLIMPGMGGGELAEKLLAERPNTEVLYISGYTDDPRTRKLMGDGVHFLGKPFSSWTLVERIQNMLTAMKQAVPAPVPPVVRFS